jgi:hypothetical protein
MKSNLNHSVEVGGDVMAEAHAKFHRRKDDDGVFLPLPLVITLLCAVASIGVAYIFATKAELANHAKVDGERIVVLEETTKHHDMAIEEIKRAVQAVDQNVRTMLIEQGVPTNRIVRPGKAGE